MGQRNSSASSSIEKIDAIIERLRGTLTEDEIKTLQKCIETEQLYDIELGTLDDEKSVISFIEVLSKILTGVESIIDIFNH